MGVKGIAAGTYQLLWLDTMNGKEVRQKISVKEGDVTWEKPAGLGTEIALSIERVE